MSEERIPIDFEYSFDEMNERLSRIEKKLELIANHLDLTPHQPLYPTYLIDTQEWKELE